MGHVYTVRAPKIGGGLACSSDNGNEERRATLERYLEILVLQR